MRWGEMLFLNEERSTQGQNDGEKGIKGINNVNVLLCEGCSPSMEVKKSNKIVYKNLDLLIFK